MTNKEKEALVKAAFPGIEGMDLSVAIGFVEDNDTVATYKNRIKQPPKVMMGAVFSPKDILKVAPAVVKGGKTVADLTKSIFTKKTATKVAEETAKAGKKKIVTKKRVAGVVGASAAVGTYNMIESGKGTDIDPNASAAEIAAQDSFAQAIANADAQGVDVTQFLQGTTAKQLNLGANNIADFMSARGYTNPLTGLNGIGIFTGKEEITSVPRKKFGGTITGTKSEIVSLSDWNKSFPVDAAGIGAAKQKFVTAGVLDPTADLTQVKAAWDKYGQLSLDYSRAGNKVSPWQLLDIQKGLTGSGSQTSVTIDDSPMTKADITTILKRQLGASLGLANIDDETINKFIKDVRKKEAKSPTKSVRTTTGNTTRVKTVQGYGQSDVLADAEAYAKQDPRYAEFQTADVFGNALVKALGLKS
jgi:hypothetical protein